MKVLFITLLASLSFASCKKEAVEPTVLTLNGTIQFSSTYIGRHFNNGVDSLMIEVEGQHTFTFKTYLSACGSTIFGYQLRSQNEVEAVKYNIWADNKIIESGLLYFTVEKKALIK